MSVCYCFIHNAPLNDFWKFSADLTVFDVEIAANPFRDEKLDIGKPFLLFVVYGFLLQEHQIIECFLIYL